MTSLLDLSVLGLPISMLCVLQLGASWGILPVWNVALWVKLDEHLGRYSLSALSRDVRCGAVLVKPEKKGSCSISPAMREFNDWINFHDLVVALERCKIYVVKLARNSCDESIRSFISFD